MELQSKTVAWLIGLLLGRRAQGGNVGEDTLRRAPHSLVDGPASDAGCMAIVFALASQKLAGGWCVGGVRPGWSMDMVVTGVVESHRRQFAMEERK